MTTSATNGKGKLKPAPEPIAIIGMRGRFPGAEDDLGRFWQNLAEGVESITPLSQEDMKASGVPEQMISLPGYVNAAPLLADVDLFDAGFFGLSARDASLTDPQQRLFLETAWEALEDAGYEPSGFAGSIGVFGGCELSSYLYQLYLNADSLGYIDGMQLMVTNDKDHLCTQVSYRLDLRGPSVAVQTTCSTSLVAVTLACESLQGGRCDMALAGGVTVKVPQRGGYFYVAGSILSPDGHCRPFDASAQGTVMGSGVGIVVLKRLCDALADGDNIRAVILGFGLNNDGSDKVGYTAPGFRGQVAAIAAAYEMSQVSPESIGYVEAHGTGTILGDPIELAALIEVFRAHTTRRGYCGIGSVKSNFGHLSCASGVVGLIKTVLTLEHGAIPPTVNYQTPNPAIDFTSSPFYVTTRLLPWERNGARRRAAVSSFGVGGTNAHVILEEAPVPAASSQSRTNQILVLSARSEVALNEATRRLGDHLEKRSEQDLADVAFTLHVGRRGFRYRRSLVACADDRTAAARSLKDHDWGAGVDGGAPPPVVFMFPGQGSQYPEMAATLYNSEPLVRKTIDRCARILKPELGLDLRRLLFADARRRKAAAEELRDTGLAQPALFVVELALAELWRSWGVQPAAMIGHSIGEYVAATLAGVMTEESALRLVARRGKLISALPSGSMLAVMAPAERLHEFIDDEICLAAVNAPSFSVLSGPIPSVERVHAALTSAGIVGRRLHTSHAFHSSMMDPILEEFESLVAQITLSPPAIPYVATLTGDWADGGPTKPDYWSKQIRSTVRFADGLHACRAKGSPVADSILLEVGPGRTLSTFAMNSENGSDPPLTFATLLSADDKGDEQGVILASLGRLWERGVPVDWAGFHRNESRRRISLPTYPFERQRYWIGTPVSPETASPAELRDPGDWFYVPRWREAQAAQGTPGHLSGAPVLVFDEGTGLGSATADELRTVGAIPIMVRRGSSFARTSKHDFLLDPADPESFGRLAAAVCTSESRLAGVVHCWGAEPPATTGLAEAALETFLSPLRLACALGTRPTVLPLPLLLVVRGTAKLAEDDALDPARSFGIGATKVLPQEHSGLRVAHVDVDNDPGVARLLLEELVSGALESEVALRHGSRYARFFEPAPVLEAHPPDLPPSPVILVTGGLGHMGMILAEAMFYRMDARLVLIGRSPLPPPQQWEAESNRLNISERTRDLLRRLAAMRAQRDDILVLGADLNDAGEVSAAFDAVDDRFGAIDLLIHGAADVSPGAFGPAEETGTSVVEAQLTPKLRGLLHLLDASKGREPKRWLLHSSISAVLGGLGLAAYAGANAVLDTMAIQGGQNWLSVAWDAWDNAGEAQMVAISAVIQPPEGQEALLRLLGAPMGSCVLVAASDLEPRLESWVRLSKVPYTAEVDTNRHSRPNLSNPFVEPRTDSERVLTEIWSSQLGVDGVGVHDRFFDLGGHSLLAVQVASEIRDRFQIEMPVLQLFKAPTISDLARLVEQAQEDSADGEAGFSSTPISPSRPGGVKPIDGEGLGAAAKASYREFYDDMTRRLERAGMGEASFFLNYGYVSNGQGDESASEVPVGVFNPNSIRLAFELIGPTDLRNRRVLDVGCGRGGTVALLAEGLGAKAVGLDLSPEAVGFCQRAHRHPSVSFEVGDAENLPFDDAAFDIVTNIESSHTYPDIRAFLAQVRRVLRLGGLFLHTDLLAVQRWMEVRALLGQLGFTIESDREITANVLSSCDEVAYNRAKAFGDRSELIDNFLAVPGSPVYEQMRSGAWEYRILRSRLK